MNSKKPRTRGMKPDRITRIPNGNSHSPKKNRGNADSLAMQTEEQERQGIKLTLVEYGQKVGTADQNQGSDFVQHIEKHNGDGDQSPQNHQEPSLCLVHRLE